MIVDEDYFETELKDKGKKVCFDNTKIYSFSVVDKVIKYFSMIQAKKE